MFASCSSLFLYPTCFRSPAFSLSHYRLLVRYPPSSPPPLKRATFPLASVPSNGSTTCTHTRLLFRSPRISFLRHSQKLTLAVIASVVAPVRIRPVWSPRLSTCSLHPTSGRLCVSVYVGGGAVYALVHHTCRRESASVIGLILVPFTTLYSFTYSRGAPVHCTDVMHADPVSKPTVFPSPRCSQGHQCRYEFLFPRPRTAHTWSLPEINSMS